MCIRYRVWIDVLKVLSFCSIFIIMHDKHTLLSLIWLRHFSDFLGTIGKFNLSSILESLYVENVELLLECLHSLWGSLAEDFRRKLHGICLLDHYIWHASSLWGVLILSTGEVRLEILLITATSDGEFCFPLNFDLIELYHLLGWFRADEFFAKVFTLSFLLPLLLFPLLVFELLDHVAPPCPKARLVVHLGEE